MNTDFNVDLKAKAGELGWLVTKRRGVKSSCHEHVDERLRQRLPGSLEGSKRAGHAAARVKTTDPQTNHISAESTSSWGVGDAYAWMYKYMYLFLIRTHPPKKKKGACCLCGGSQGILDGCYRK